MSRIERKLFYRLLERWVKENHFKAEMKNGCLCLLPNLDYDVVIKSSTMARTQQ